MVADDEVLFNESLAFLVEVLGGTAVPAYDGFQALEIVRNDEIDVVISDVSMPGMNGIELLRQIKEFNENLPVIIISGGADDELEDEAIEHGAIGFLPKPITHEALASMIRDALMETKPGRIASEV